MTGSWNGRVTLHVWPVASLATPAAVDE